MKITDYSRKRIMESAAYWEVPRDYFEPLYNYLVFAFHPGGFWRAALANDFVMAMQHSHPNNSIPRLKNTAGWIRDTFPDQAVGSYDSVDRWCQSTPEDDRRKTLESVGLIYTEKQEVEMVLRGIAVKPDPVLW
jgi:hypothetical protein